ncbi:muramidase (phage lysozyme) [Rhizobium sp. SG_E_25_P2]|uniref:hypothetical protein n=1 Tax=Rhizobium sp. SG_E_25_P2 TaxID=2879942 RepID=UPI0024737185|nr:hypothetical protein [Rhizobium sp. SG_E_25_P2]MDH6265647.1 muramidase (phage lysozyme) [Rhizobium sp. SG_E_25_P2]
MVEIAPLGALVVDIEARVDKLEKGIAKANAAQRRGATEMENRARQSARKIEDTYSRSFDRIGKTIENGFAAFSRGSAAVAGAGAAALAFKEIANSVAEVDREARKAGVSAKVWQQWAFVAKATGASVDGVTDALKEMNIRANEFALTGKGGGAEWFTRFGYSAEEVGRKLREPNAFLDELIGKIKQLDQAGQTRAVDELFGGTGAEELSKALGLSVEQIQKLRSEAATFSAEQIESAKRVNAAWDTMWANFTVRAKAAAIEGANIAASIAQSIRDAGESVGADKWLDGTRLAPGALEAGRRDYDQRQELAELNDLLKQRAELMAELEGMSPLARSLGFDESVKANLREVDARIREVQQALQDTRPVIDGVKDSSEALSPAFDRNATAAINFKTALAELKALVPGLKADFDALAQSDALNTAYQNAARNARSMGELWQATDIASRARSIATYGQHDNILDLIGAAEGTDRGRGYNETLGYGAFTGGAQNLTGMTLDEIMALQGRMLANPANTFNSSAVGRYQITRQTLQDAMRQMNLAGDRTFDAATQDEIARWLLRSTGGNVDALRGRWEGLQRVDVSTIRNAYAGTPTAAQNLDPSPGQQRQTDLLRQQTDARRNLNQTVQEGLDQARFEQSISGMSERQRRIELEVYRAQQQAKREGITLSDQELQKIREKIAMTQQLEAKNQQVAASTEGLKQGQQFFAESFTQSLSGLLTGTTTLQGAVQSLLNSLIDATLQAALLGKGPLSGILGGGTGLLGMIFGFSSGGYTGDGGKFEPAGIVHRGEYVMSKDATKRLGAANLEALHRAALGKPGYAKGGLVGSPAKLAPVSSEHRGGGVTAQAITINSPVTVNATGGDAQQNADLARQVAKEHENMMRAVVRQEVFNMQKPGNLLNR